MRTSSVGSSRPSSAAAVETSITWPTSPVRGARRRCHNARRRSRVMAEVAVLRPLPVRRTTDFTELTVAVTRNATITVDKVLYSVPSRLIGHRLRVHLYDDRLEGFLGSDRVAQLPRVVPSAPGARRSSTTTMSSPACAASHRPCAISPTGRLCFHALSIGVPGKPSTRPYPRPVPAGSRPRGSGRSPLAIMVGLLDLAARVLTLTYKDGQQELVVPPGTPVVTLAPGDASLLKPGNHVFLGATPQPGGELTASRIMVGKDGLVPPM